jgi:serine phosphatase RsbU (regulator of sigma subunit)
MIHPTTIRRGLLLNLAAVVLLLSGAITAVTLFGAQETSRRLSRDLTSRALDQTETQLRLFFEPVQNSLLMARAWGEAGLIQLDSPLDINKLFAPALHQWPQISALIVADSAGREQTLMHVDGVWITRITHPQEWGGYSLFLRWPEDGHEPSTEWREVNYDPRLRPWFSGTLLTHPTLPAATADAATISWTEPYTFFTNNTPGMTATTHYRDPQGNQYVVGLDVSLVDITTFTTGIRISANSKVAVLTEDQRLIGLPRDQRFEDGSSRSNALLKHPQELQIPLATDAALRLSARTADDSQPVRFVSGGETWWADARRFTFLDGRPLIATVLVPEADLLADVQSLRRWIGAITVAVLLWGLWRALALARRYSRPIEALVRQSERISRGDLEPGAAIASNTFEVRRLAEAQDQMRTSLRSLLKLENDLQLARDIQRRAFPATLPQPRGYEIVAYSQPADATGGDIYDAVGFSRSALGTAVALTDRDPEHALMMLADATGHGIGPALSVVQVRAMLRMGLRTGTPLLSLAKHLNSQLRNDLHAGRFVTAWIGHLDCANHQLHYFSAGQAPLLWYQSRSLSTTLLMADGPPFGILDDWDTPLPPPLRLQVGDAFAVLSDGILEARNVGGEPFGTDKVAELMQQHGHASAQTLLEALCVALGQHCDGRKQTDDQTAVIIRRSA